MHRASVMIHVERMVKEPRCSGGGCQTAGRSWGASPNNIDGTWRKQAGATSELGVRFLFVTAHVH